MTVRDVERRVAAIAAMTRDDEAAHSAEDQLRGDVLRAIADGSAKRPRAIAAAALVTDDLDFARWCA